MLCGKSQQLAIINLARTTGNIPACQRLERLLAVLEQVADERCLELALRCSKETLGSLPVAIKAARAETADFDKFILRSTVGVLRDRTFDPIHVRTLQVHH